MNYSDHPHDVKLIVFTESGKWKYEERLSMLGTFGELTPEDAVLESLKQTRWSDAGRLYPGYIFVVPEPCHKNAYPVLIKS
jgi:hypothetical protein